MAGDILGNPTVFTGVSVTSTPGSAQTIHSIPVLQVQGGSQITVASNTSLILSSGATLTMGGVAWSLRTVGAHTSLASIGPTDPDNMQVAVIHRASGLSLLLRSGNTIYYFNSDASGAA
jgi:hypothetical protein